MVYGLYVPSPAIGFFATVIRAPWRELDISTEMSGQHDFAVRLRRPRQERHPRPPHPRPALMTLRNAPCRWDGMARHIAQFSFLENRNIFLRRA
jgi:hypothetical protein